MASRHLEKPGSLHGGYCLADSGFPTRTGGTATPMHDHGQVVGSVLTFSDVSEREQARESLRIGELAMSSATSALANVDTRSADYPIVDVNPAFVRLTQYSAEETIGRSHHDDQ